MTTWLVYDKYIPDYPCYYVNDVKLNHPNCVDEDSEVQSGANGLLVSAELGYDGGDYAMLRARADASAPGPWEQFDLIHLSSDNADSNNPSSLTYALRSLANGLFVSAELGYAGDYYGMLRARSGAIGPWEQYRMVALVDGLWAMMSLANGLFVSAELGYGGNYYGMLRARSAAIGSWEEYWPYGA